MNLRVLRPKDGKMMKLVQYSLGTSATGNITGTGVSGSKAITIQKQASGDATVALTVATSGTTGTVTATPTTGKVTASVAGNTLTITVADDADVGAYNVELKNGDAGATVLDTITVNVIAAGA